MKSRFSWYQGSYSLGYRQKRTRRHRACRRILKVSYSGARINVGEDHIETVLKYDKTRAMVDDGSTMTIKDVNTFQVRVDCRVHG